MREFNPVAEAESWKRPYTSMQWAWVRALGVEPSRAWDQGRAKTRKTRPDGREIREAMGQRYGIRGL